MKSSIYIIAFLCLSLMLNAQTDTVYLEKQFGLDSLTIEEILNSSIDNALSICVQEVDLKTLTIYANKFLQKNFNYADTITVSTVGLANSLEQQSNVYINTSSPDGLAALSLNGAAAKSIPVMWQNHNLNSVMNGIIDVNLLDGFLFNQLEINYADSFEQAGWGGNAATLNVKNFWYAPIHIQHQFGSFGKQKIGFAYKFNFKNIYNYTKAFYLKANNNFPVLHPQLKKPKQSNNAIKSWGVLHNTSFYLRHNQDFDINIWWQNTEREIASPLFTSNNNSSQIDSTFRVTLDWKYQPLNLKASIAYFNELNAYYNPKIGVTGVHKTIALKSYIIHHLKINDGLRLSNSISYNNYKATSTNFETTKFRNSLFFKSVLTYQLNAIPLNLKADFVVDFTDKELLPVRPGIYATYKHNEKIKIGAQLSRHYSLPTFNDLYWAPGGNNTLLPENGYITNLHFTYGNNLQLIKLNLFNNTINNQIVWLPSNSNIWSPENINKLRGYGCNATAKQNFTLNEINNLDVSFNYTYNVAQNIDDNFATNLQLIYRPKHKAGINLNYNYNNQVNLNYSHQITGKRFITTDNLNSVPAFNTANFSIKYLTGIDKAQLSIEASAQNIFNTYYEVVANRPMPGTHFLITTNLYFE